MTGEEDYDNELSNVDPVPSVHGTGSTLQKNLYMILEHFNQKPPGRMGLIVWLGQG